jgi:hypothetical protein
MNTIINSKNWCEETPPPFLTNMNMDISTSYSMFHLEQIKIQIEQLNKIHHIEILKIFKKFQNVKLNENKSGVFINLSFLPTCVIDELNAYLDHVKIQESQIFKMESQKENFKHFLINESEKEDKDKVSFHINSLQSII